MNSFSLIQSGPAMRNERNPRRNAQVGLQDPLELEQGLVVKADVAEVARRRSRLPSGRTPRRWRERVALVAGEALFLRRGHDLAVAQEAGGAVVVIGGNTEDVYTCGTRHAVSWLPVSWPRDSSPKTGK